MVSRNHLIIEIDQDHGVLILALFLKLLSLTKTVDL